MLSQGSFLTISEERLASIRENSFKNFHAKGLHYLCLYRSPVLTMKAYFFEGDLGSLPEVVIPHNHRYPFTTTVMSGRVRNRRFQESPERAPDAQPFNRFNYYTPLNGGDGFHFDKEVFLAPLGGNLYEPGQWYASYPDEIHTLQIESSDAVIGLYQYEDAIPLTEPTQAFRFGSKEPLSLSGLYDRFSKDELITRLHDLAAMGVVF